MPWEPDEGDLIGDRYRMAEFLGKGGISIVWRAEDTETGEDVAVKFPNYGSSNSKEIVDGSLRNELDIMTAIDEAGGHPNVMSLVDSVVHDDKLFIVAGYVQGEVLEDAVARRNGITDEGDVRRIGIGLCEAMSFLHRNEVIYRDLKPDNVMLEADMTPVLIDFNTAKGFEADVAADGASIADTVIPNPVYKPPELNNDPDLVGYRQGPWSDVYSIGKTLMFLLSGSGVRKDAVDPRDFPGTRSVPGYLAEIIERATQKHKDDRYRNATVLARVLTKRDPEPPELAHLEHVQGGETYEIYPGDTIGRQAADGPQPSIALADPDNYISAVQVQLDVTDDGEWVLVDRSLNGTWVNAGEGWRRVLSAAGRERLEEKGEDPAADGDAPPEQVVLETGDEIALVHPEYGVWLRFTGETDE